MISCLMPSFFFRSQLVRKNFTLALTCCIALAVSAGTIAAQETKSEDAKDAYKLAQKQVKKGDLAEAEKLLRRSLEIEIGRAHV